MSKSERKRLRKGISLTHLDPTATVGIPRVNLESAIEQAKSLSVNLYRTRPKESAWVYRFSVPDTHVVWVGVRFSEEPERADLTDNERLIRLEPIIGFHNGERFSPNQCTTVHGFRPYQLAAMRDVLQNPGRGEISISFPSNELIEKYREYFRKHLRKD